MGKEIKIYLYEDEMKVLQAIAHKELRHPRDQARYLLRAALGLVEQPATMPRAKEETSHAQPH